MQAKTIVSVGSQVKQMVLSFVLLRSNPHQFQSSISQPVLKVFPTKETRSILVHCDNGETLILEVV